MKVKILYILVIIVSLSQMSIAQELMSESAKALAEEIKIGNNESILDAGKLGDKTVIPYLIILASNSKYPWAQMALAKLGENKYLSQILAEVDVEDPDVQDKAMRKLSYVGGEVAIKKFYELLDDTSAREGLESKKYPQTSKENSNESKVHNVIDVAIYWSRSSTAIYHLSRVVDNPPTKKGLAGTENDIAAWKEWFKKNKPWIQ